VTHGITSQKTPFFTFNTYNLSDPTCATIDLRILIFGLVTSRMNIQLKKLTFKLP
jgi:hypothetical protein